MTDLEEIQSVFFMAMREGWASGAEKSSIPDLPGYRSILFQYRRYHVLDRYCANPETGKSAGETTIWRALKPVWVMHYGGQYDERAIPFLQRALREAYRENKFFGGRGPLTFWDKEFVVAGDTLLYMNNARANDFGCFAGREEIFVFDNEEGTSLGYHDYWGMSLI